MAITRNTSIPKPHQQQQQEPTQLPPLHPLSETIPNSNNNNNNNNNEQQQTVSNYEQTREQRIKENRERLQKLGIVDLSTQLTSIVASKRSTPKRNHERKTPLKSPFIASNDTPRRSSRLQNAPPVSYTEPKEEKSRKTRDIVLEEGAKPEVYTEEHEKLLGNTEMEWTFGVDGCRPDGTRIYDSINGKTCHQCRQKTLGLRTRCSKCNLVQGQFCGDCLIARYGEHVVEANQNPNWICPPCRGICNCSLCRQTKGWYPTGAIYRAVIKEGYKSVAHYLIATKRATPDSNTASEAPQSAKRALPFEDDSEPESKAMVESTEINQQSENNDIIVDESASTRKTRRSEEKENGSCQDKLEVKKAIVGRPRKKSKNETNDAGIAIVSNVAPLDSNTGSEDPQPARGAFPFEDDNGPESKTMVENTEKIQQSENNDIIVDESASTRKTRKSEEKENGSCQDKLEVKKASIGRQRKKPKNETNDAGNAIVSNVDTPNTETASKLSDSKENSIARRLRSRNKT